MEELGRRGNEKKERKKGKKRKLRERLEMEVLLWEIQEVQ